MTDKQGKWLLIVAVLILIALIVLVICCLTRSKSYAWVSACGEDSVQIVVKGPDDPQPSTYSQFPISGPITDIPEFNDCQRFVKDGKYGASYAIFVAYYLEEAMRVVLLDSAVHDTTLRIAKMGTSRFAIPVATVYSWGGTYEPLGIEPGFNCLFLHRDTAKGSPVTPRMVPWGQTDPDCGALRPVAEGPDERLNGGKDLVLQEAAIDVTTYPMTFHTTDFPPVARWDYDPNRHEHYIGLTCGDAWCEIGNTGIGSSQPIGLPTTYANVVATPTTKNRVSAVRGWYDEQQLAPSTGVSGQPSAVIGRLVPHPNLDAVNSTPNSYRTWVSVALADVNGDYKSFKSGENTIELCHGSATDEECDIPTADRACAPNPLQSDNWWARITPPGQSPAYKCVKRMGHKDAIDAFNATHFTQIRIPGTVRWRWLETDEATWISCETGCCTVRN